MSVLQILYPGSQFFLPASWIQGQKDPGYWIRIKKLNFFQKNVSKLSEILSGMFITVSYLFPSVLRIRIRDPLPFLFNP
jgi:hypothetical protein